MNDEQLIELVQQTPAEELTQEQIQLLRERLAASPALRAALHEHLQIEQALSAALGPIDLSVDRILARNQQPPRKMSVLQGVLGLAICLALLLFVGAVFMFALRGKDAQLAGVKDNDPASKDAANDAAKDQGKKDAGKKPDLPDKTTVKKLVGDPISPVKTGTDTNPKPPDNTAPAPGEVVPGEVAPAKPAPGPWDEELAAPPRIWSDVAFRDFDLTKSLATETELRRWVAPVKGINSKITTDRNRGQQRSGVLEGTVRLLAPFTEDSFLRISTEGDSKLAVHFFRGEKGVSLYRYQHYEGPWAAYLTTREKGGALPKTWELASTHSGNYSRSELRYCRSFDLRVRGGRVSAAALDVELVAANLGGPPEDVFISAEKTVFRGIKVMRTDTDPPFAEPRPLVAVIDRPADLPWGKLIGKGGKFEKLPDGAVRLTADKAEEFTWISAPLPKNGLQMVEMLIDTPKFGGGVFLGHAANNVPGYTITQIEGYPRDVFSIQRDKRTGQYAPQWRHWDDPNFEREFSYLVAERPVPLVKERTQAWIRILQGQGMARYWTSKDGENWTEHGAKPYDVLGDITHLGLSCGKGIAGCEITLKQVRLRQLDGLMALADAALFDRAPYIQGKEGLASWLVEVNAKQPADVSADDWRRACALKSLARVVNEPLATDLTLMLVDEPGFAQRPLEKQLRALDDMALLMRSPTNTNDPRYLKIYQAYIRAGSMAQMRGEAKVFDKVRQALMRAPMVGYPQVISLVDSLMRTEMYGHLYRNEWAELAALNERVALLCDYTALTTRWQVLPWFASIVARKLPDSAPIGTAKVLKYQSLQPLVLESNKEAFNVRSEFNASIEAKSFKDACRIITEVDKVSYDGLLPDARDDGLVVSFPTAIALAMREFPELAQTMNQEFGPLARLRVRRAIAQGDAEGLLLSVSRFPGTKAIIEAHRWLGDRELGSGNFARASAHYEQARLLDPAGDQAALDARLRLSAAMQGRSYGEPVQAAVTLGDSEMSAADFENLVAEMLASNGRGTVKDVTSTDKSAAKRTEFSQPTPAASGWEAEASLKFDGEVGMNPYDLSRWVKQYEIPWFERQTAFVRDGDLLLVNNRAQLTAYSIPEKKRLWDYKAAPGYKAPNHPWPLVPMRPLVAGDKIFVRQFNNSGPVLNCVQRATGAKVWTYESDKDDFIICDPFLLAGRLSALGIAKLDSDTYQLRLLAFDSKNGEVESERNLLRMRNSWLDRRFCQTAIVDGNLVASFGGFVMSCDSLGGIRWIRQQEAPPASDEGSWARQYHQPPLAQGDKLYVAQAGVPLVECLDAASGRKAWATPVVDLRRIIGCSKTALLAQTEQGILALDLQTGQFLWNLPIEQMTDVCVYDGGAQLLLSRRTPHYRKAGQFVPELIWIDVERGEIAARTWVDFPVATAKYVSAFSVDGKLWMFIGKELSDATRELLVLKPSKQQPLVQATLDGDGRWLDPVEPLIARPALYLFPDWQLLSVAPNRGGGVLDAIRGVTDVLSLACSPTTPIVFVRKAPFPAQAKKLRIKVGPEPGHNWRLVVAAGGKTLLTQDVIWEQGKREWIDFEIPLPAEVLAGNPEQLVITAQFKGPADHNRLYWKSIEVVP